MSISPPPCPLPWEGEFFMWGLRPTPPCFCGTSSRLFGGCAHTLPAFKL